MTFSRNRQSLKGMKKSKIFSDEHVYGHVLEFLYLNADKRYGFNNLSSEFGSVDQGYLRTCLTWLKNDKLIQVESHDYVNINLETGMGKDVTDELYRISYEGFKFIFNLKSTRKTHAQSIVAIVISAVAVVISLASFAIDDKRNLGNSETQIIYNGVGNIHSDTLHSQSTEKTQTNNNKADNKH